MAASPTYQPADNYLTLEALEFLARPAGAALRAAAATTQGVWTASQIERARHGLPAHLKSAVHAALTLGALQAKATGPKGKFPELDYVWAPPEALEQATSLRVARHKARRFAQALAAHPVGDGPAIWDLCCGIGGDTLALAAVAPTLAIDLSEVRLWCCRQNAHALEAATGTRLALTTRATDVCNLGKDVAERGLLAGRLFHIDPSRRDAGRRSHAWKDLVPGPDGLRSIIAAFAASEGPDQSAGAIKLSPGVAFDELPPTGHVEVISENGTAVQAVLWLGALRPGPEHERTATVLSVDAPPFSLTGTPERAPEAVIPAPAAWLYEVNAGVHRAGLAGTLAKQLGLDACNLDGGYATGPEMLDHPALTRFRTLATVAYSPRRVVEALQSHAAAAPPGAIEVKTRGGLGLDTDRLQREWSAAAHALTVLIYRGPSGLQASIAQRA
jgi:hypothetical protein